MLLLFFIIIIIFCLAFSYLFYRILEVERDIDCLYKDYSSTLQKDIKVISKLLKEDKKEVS